MYNGIREWSLAMHALISENGELIWATYFAIVTTNVETACCRVQLVHYFHLGHKSSDSDVVMTMFRQEELAGQLHLGCLQGEVAEEATFLLNK